jgi:hypothetical protein
MNRGEYDFTQIIQKLDTLRDFGIEEARIILHIAKRRAFAPDEVVWNPGEESTDLLAHRLTHTRHEQYRRTTPTERDEKIW